MLLNRIYYHCKNINMKLFIAVLLLISSISLQASSLKAIDSVGVFSKSGKDFILHKVEVKETFYSVSRLYKKDPKVLMELNPTTGNSLTIGDTILIPTILKKSSKSLKASSLIKHTVESKETLFSIAKKYDVSIESISGLNKLKNNELSIGMILSIPTKLLTKESDKPTIKTNNKTIEKPVEKIASKKKEDVIDTPTVKLFPVSPIEKPDLPDTQATIYNKSVLGSFEVTEKGLAKRLDGSNLNPTKSLALHITAPVGTIIKVTNLQNDKSVLVKVIGTLPLSGENKNVIIMISKKAAEMIDMIDEKAQVTLSYGRKND